MIIQWDSPLDLHQLQLIGQDFLYDKTGMHIALDHIGIRWTPDMSPFHHDVTWRTCTETSIMHRNRRNMAKWITENRFHVYLQGIIGS